VHEEDLEFFRSATATPEDVLEHLSFIVSDAKGKTEVNLRILSADECTLMGEAKGQEVDQWISNSVFKIVRKSGVPFDTHNGDEMDFDMEKTHKALKPKPGWWQRDSQIQNF
jgi:hypothetical protein